MFEANAVQFLPLNATLAWYMLSLCVCLSVCPSVTRRFGRYCTMPISGVVCHCKLGLDTINLPTKFEVFISIHHSNMKVNTRCGKWGWFGIVRGHSRSLEIPRFNRAYIAS